MAHEPGHDIPVDLDFSIEITPPPVPPLKPPQMPKGCFSLNLPIGGIMGFVRNKQVELESHVRNQVEGLYDQVETQVYEKLPTEKEITNFMLGYGCGYEQQVTDYYNQLKRGLQQGYTAIDGIKSKVDKALKDIDTLKNKISEVENILSGLAEPLGIAAGIISAAKIAINLMIPGSPVTVGTPAAVILNSKNALDAASAQVCVMNGEISGLPQPLGIQVQRLTDMVGTINPYIEKLNALIAEVQKIEAIVEASYLQWFATCTPGDEVPPENPLKDHHLIKTYEAITNNIDQYPETNPDDWNEVSNELSKTIPPEPLQWENIQNYVIRDKVTLVFGPPPPDETGGRFLIKYYAAVRDNLDKYPEISPQDWNILRTVNANEIPEDNTPEWKGTTDYIVEDVVKIIIDLNEGSFNQAISNIVDSAGPEVIEKLYNANFRMIGYKRYRE